MSSFSNHSVSNIVDEWLKDDGGLLPTATAAPVTTSTTVDLSSSKGRGGLGFENKGAVQEGSRVKNDALLDKLKKSNKRKRDDEKQQVTSAPLTHGQVEDDEELESRIKIVSTLGKKPESDVKKAAPQPPKKDKAVASAPPTAKAGPQAPASASSQPKSNTPAAQAPQQSQRQEKEAVVPPPTSDAAAPPTSSSATSTDYHANADGDFTAVKKRKRIKTRSKQKNIRRDNRPDDQKPAHLKFGKGYKGRPITPQTKERLGQK